MLTSHVEPLRACERMTNFVMSIFAWASSRTSKSTFGNTGTAAAALASFAWLRAASREVGADTCSAGGTPGSRPGVSSLPSGESRSRLD